MDILFLDIDGVLVTQKSNELGLCPFDNQPLFEDECFDNLNLLCVEFDLKIVLSSNWRYKKNILQILENRFFDADIIGMTANSKEIISNGYLEYYPTYCRGLEIQHWLDNNNVDNYIILDDMPPKEFLPNQRNYLVQTTVENIKGFHKKHYEIAREMLIKLTKE